MFLVLCVRNECKNKRIQNINQSVDEEKGRDLQRMNWFFVSLNFLLIKNIKTINYLNTKNKQKRIVVGAFCFFVINLELGALVIPFLLSGSPVLVPLRRGFTVLEGSTVFSPLAVAVVDFTPGEVALLDDIFVLSEGTLDTVAVVVLSLLEEAGEGFRGGELVEGFSRDVDGGHCC